MVFHDGKTVIIHESGLKKQNTLFLKKKEQAQKLRCSSLHHPQNLLKKQF
jgi:hypothetical protein